MAGVTKSRGRAPRAYASKLNGCRFCFKNDDQPTLDRIGDKLRPIVAANKPGSPRTITKYATMARTSLARIERPTSIARDSRVYSYSPLGDVTATSIIVDHCPRTVWSLLAFGSLYTLVSGATDSTFSQSRKYEPASSACPGPAGRFEPGIQSSLFDRSCFAREQLVCLVK